MSAFGVRKLAFVFSVLWSAEACLRGFTSQDSIRINSAGSGSLPCYDKLTYSQPLSYDPTWSLFGSGVTETLGQGIPSRHSFLMILGAGLNALPYELKKNRASKLAHSGIPSLLGFFSAFLE
jgi:hypothetical protein